MSHRSLGLRNLWGCMSFPSKFAFPSTLHVRMPLICIALLMSVAGCNNSCFVGVINPPNNSLTVSAGNPPPVCAQLQPMAAVKVVAHLAQTCTRCSPSRQVTEVHLLLSGMELHPDTVADEDSSEWQELTPDWARQPQWVDLLGDSTANEAALPLNLPVQISAGTYRQFRFRIAQLSVEDAEQLHGKGHCSPVVASCVVTADGNSHPLQTLDGPPFFRLKVAPPIDLRANQANQLRIEIRPEWALHVPSIGVLDLMPVLGGDVLIQLAPAMDSL
jgi:hypothetical protein